MTHERRVFVEVNEHKPFSALSAEDCHHFKNVLRLKAGSTVIAVDKDSGAEFESEFNPETCSVKILRERPKRPQSALSVTLCFAACKGKTNDFIAEKATELGAANIIFWQAARSIVDISEKDEARKLSRWQSIAESAAKQSARIDLPLIKYLRGIDEVITAVSRSDSQKFFCSLANDSLPLSSFPRLGPEIAIVIGPEGDFTAPEEETLVSHTFKRVTLGYNRLRSETAAIAALAAINTVYTAKQNV
jgi:16S rRNA (uracil1498-N3)-methyltransferase